MFGSNNTTASVIELNCKLCIHVIINIKHVHFFLYSMWAEVKRVSLFHNLVNVRFYFFSCHNYFTYYPSFKTFQWDRQAIIASSAEMLTAGEKTACSLLSWRLQRESKAAHRWSVILIYKAPLTLRITAVPCLSLLACVILTVLYNYQTRFHSLKT